MIRPTAAIALGAFTVFAASAVAQTPLIIVVRPVMQEWVNPAMLGIWDISNNAMDEEGHLDPAQMTDQKWTTIAASAEDLAKAGRDLATAAQVVAASPGSDAVGDGEVPMAQVQRKLAADPAGFRAHARALAEHATKIAAAARAHDAAATGALVGEMDAVCEACHAAFWYPE